MKTKEEKKPRKIDRERALQIMNNVAEEFADHGQTNFATKKELCETIQILRDIHWNDSQRLRDGIDKSMTILLAARIPS